MDLTKRLEQAEKLISGNSTSGLLVAVDNTNTLQHNQQVINEIQKQMIMGVTVPLHSAYNMLKHEALTLQNRKALADIFGMNATELKTAFNGLARNNEIKDAIGVVPDNEYQYIKALMEKWDTAMTFQKIYKISTPYFVAGNFYNEETLRELGKQMSVFVKGADPKTLAFAEMLAKVIKTNAEMSMGYTVDQITRALEDWTRQQQNFITATAKMNVTFDPTVVVKAEAEWDKLVNAITEINVAESKAVLKHFIWQVKRKMFGKHVDKHMMPVLNGLQEIGKSTIVKQLVKPIAEFTIMTNFKAITDERSHDLWKNYVLILDEMGNSTQSNIEEIKQKITADSFSSRLMRTNTDTNVVNHATMIGTTNRDLSTLIFDDTGMRRFFQIACKSVFDWTVTDAIDYELLWKSINEDSDSILVSDKDLAAKVKAIQGKSRMVGGIEEFFRSREYAGGKGGTEIFADDLYKEYKEYEEEHEPNGHMSSTKFGRDLINLPGKIPNLVLEKMPTRKNNKWRYHIAKVGAFE